MHAAPGKPCLRSLPSDHGASAAVRGMQKDGDSEGDDSLSPLTASSRSTLSHLRATSKQFAILPSIPLHLSCFRPLTSIRGWASCPRFATCPMIGTPAPTPTPFRPTSPAPPPKPSSTRKRACSRGPS